MRARACRGLGEDGGRRSGWGRGDRRQTPRGQATGKLDRPQKAKEKREAFSGGYGFFEFMYCQLWMVAGANSTTNIPRQISA